MLKRKDMEFRRWVEENNLSERDLQHMQKVVRNRALLYWILCWFTPLAIIMLPFLVEAWIYYKFIKQRTFEPRFGLFFSLHVLAMYITFLTIIPAIIWFIVQKGSYGTGIRRLFKKGLIGQGE